MRTTRNIFITALLFLGVVLYAQDMQVDYITANYLEKTSRFENLLDGIVSLTDRFTRDEMDEPVVCMSFAVNEANVIYEENYILEAWMTVPFETSVAEEELNPEPWMMAPFETSLAEVDPGVEPWMTAPWI